ncbi:MAG: helix-turn-helix domain-containing protein [Polyangiaceae bacterium]
MNHDQPIHASAVRQMLRDGTLLTRASAQGAHEMEQDEVLTLREVARLLRFERHTIKKLIDLGLPSHRIGSMRRFLRSEVLAWLKAQEETK